MGKSRWGAPRGAAMYFGLLASLLAGGMTVQAQAGLVDARAAIEQADARLGAQPGTVVLDRPARLEGQVTLRAGHGLRIEAPLSVGAATIRLSGHNDVRCEAPLTADHGVDLFVADGVTDLSVRGCDVTVPAPGGGYLLTASRAVRVTETDNHLVNMALFNTHNSGGPANQTTDVSVTGNSTDFTGPAGPIGVYLLYVLRATVTGNRFRGTGHGVQWWGGDGNIGWRGAAAVTFAGDLSITGNECYQAGGACVWGSMGFNVTVSGNSADFCSDVCFDTEGGVRNIFTGNVARDCHAGCYSAQFQTEDVVFSGNLAYADTKMPALALVLIKHQNGNPNRHVNLTVTGNTLTCASVCTALYSEGEDGLDFSHNTITNGVVSMVNYTQSVRIRGNEMRFTLPLGRQAAISGPSLFNGHTSEIEGNSVLNEAQGIDAQASCIGQAWTDDNNTDEMRLVRNTCVGFPVGIITETAGHNGGAPHAVWFLEGNHFSGVPAASQIVHRHTSGNEVYTAESK